MTFIASWAYPKLYMFLQEFSPDGRFIISADRDFKIRVTHRTVELWCSIFLLFFLHVNVDQVILVIG